MIGRKKRIREIREESCTLQGFGRSKRCCWQSACPGLPDWGVWGWSHAHERLPFSHSRESFRLPHPFLNFSHYPYLPGPQTNSGFPKHPAQEDWPNSRCPVRASPLANYSFRPHCLLVICSRHMSNASLVPRQSPDLKVGRQHGPHSLNFGSKSQCRITLTHEFLSRAPGVWESW